MIALPLPMPSYDTIGVFAPAPMWSPKMLGLLGAQRAIAFPTDRKARVVEAVVSWNHGDAALLASQYAARHGLPHLRLERGFVCAVSSTSGLSASLSFVIDSAGMHYDASAPSTLEHLIFSCGDLSATDLQRTKRLIAAVVNGRVSQFNDTPPGLPKTLQGPKDRLRVLVVAETNGARTLSPISEPRDKFHIMLDSALSENPEAQVFVLGPDRAVVEEHCNRLDTGLRSRVVQLAEPTSPIELLEAVDRVYCATAHLGFEALLVGKPVTCFGTPFYAGWGLTDDRIPISRRGRQRTVEQLFHCAYLGYARYLHPRTGKPCEAETVVDHMALQRRLYEKNRGAIYCFGFSFWKQGYVRDFLASPGNRVEFCRTFEAAIRKGCTAGCHVLSWGRKNEREAQALASEIGAPLWRMEDGFLRSVGLGADLTAPASLVLDTRGIYFDPRTPSDLEHILTTASFDDEARAEAAQLRAAILETRVSKYNLSDDGRLDLHAKPGQAVVLVPGQVEDDASIQLGCRDVRTNLDLLRHTRLARPDAFIVWKPHPDVAIAGRKGAVPPEQAAQWADLTVTDKSIIQCLDVATEVHTMTSLVGFEALLRGLEVTTYGQPFYSGFGLTHDRHPVARRQRQLTLDELVYGVLVLYPRYVDVRSGHFTTAQEVIAALAEERQTNRMPSPLSKSKIIRRLRMLYFLWKGIAHAR